MPISLMLDIIISVLLVLTIAYAMRLNQRLSQLRSDKNELMKLAKTFADATVRAEEGIQKLKVSSDSLKSEVAKAEALKDDLAYLVDRGGRTADEMVDTVRAPSRTQGGKRANEAFNGQGRSSGNDGEARLIEDAIRAASPGGEDDAGLDATPFTRRIAGRKGGNAMGGNMGKSGSDSLGNGPQAVAKHLASRGLGGGHDLDNIENTDAARELLKALGSVK